MQQICFIAGLIIFISENEVESDNVFVFQCRRYKYDDEVRLKADMVYNRFKVCRVVFMLLECNITRKGSPSKQYFAFLLFTVVSFCKRII